MSIIVSSICCVLQDRSTLFENISFSIPTGKKASLLGNNGTGKSTIIKMLAGELKPYSGEISLGGTHWFVPQHYGQYDGMSIASALGIEGKIRALDAILQGDVGEDNYTILDDDWEVSQRLAKALSRWDMGEFTPDTPMERLSGGEKTKVFLAGIDLHSPAVVLMDEPSNHLDSCARELLYNYIRDCNKTLLVVSHDRQLLNLVDFTLELNHKGITLYGGSYDFYREQYLTGLDAIQDRIAEKQKAIAAQRRKARETIERKQKMDARGEKKQKKAGVPRIMMNSLRDGAEKSAAKLQDKHSEKIDESVSELRDLRAGLPDLHSLRIALDSPSVHNGKILVEAKQIQFRYGDGPQLWPEPLDLLIRSGDRVAISGKNGSGKTTLLRIITGQALPTSGSLATAGFTHLYVDQEYSLIDNDLTVLEQATKSSREDIPKHMVGTELDRFLFPAPTWDKKCAVLSGGEKMRLALCSILLSNCVPDMLILDEPTNNLDIRSMEILTAAVKSYTGTLLVISHDTAFKEELGITAFIDL